jgi:hypothetical protein
MQFSPFCHLPLLLPNILLCIHVKFIVSINYTGMKCQVTSNVMNTV